MYEAGECTHPYKRKIEASVEKGRVEGGGGSTAEEGRYISEGRKDYGV